jgi:hypothetical protein
MNPLRLLCLALVVAIELCAANAVACRCLEPTPAVAYRRAAVVVQARVIEVRPRADISGADVIIRVEQAWKQSISETLLVTSGSSCRYEMAVGSQHLMYLRTTSNEPWTTGRCMGNKTRGSAGVALSWLAKHGTSAKLSRPQAQQ